MTDYIVTDTAVDILADVVTFRTVTTGKEFQVIGHLTETSFGIGRCADYLRAVARGKYDAATGMPVKFFETYPQLVRLYGNLFKQFDRSLVDAESCEDILH